MIAIPFILSFLHDYFFFQFHPLLFNFIEFSYHIWCLFFIMFLKFVPGVDPFHVPSHGLGRKTKVNEVNWIYFFIVREVKMTLF